jgi:hypothetical protein
MTQKSLQILVFRRMKSLIRKGWTQRTFARDASGRIVRWTAPDAVCFCLAGARMRALAELNLFEDYLIRRSIDHKIRVVTNNNPVLFNDHIAKSKADILRKIDEAIALCLS